MNFFSPDSKFSQVMTSVGEMMLLNLCWIVGSLPLVTVGASNAAMYTVMGRRLRQEGSGTIVPFFKAWKSNLKMGILFWLAQVFVSVSLGMSLFLPLPLFFRIIAGFFLLLATLLFSIIYPQIARFHNRPFAYLRNAVILLVLKLGQVLLNLLVFLSPLLVFLLLPAEFLRLGFIWILFGFSLLFYLSAKIAQKILQPMESQTVTRRQK